MRTMNCSTLGMGFCLSLFSGASMALVGGAGVDANTATSVWSGVGAITINGRAYSGALIGPEYVLTAAHVVANQVATPGNVKFNLNAGGDLSQSITAEAIYVYPGYKGQVVGSDHVWHDDLALVKLSSAAASGVKIYGLATREPALGSTLTMVGYGASGDGTHGTLAGSSSTLKRTGQNRIDEALTGNNGSGNLEVLLFDFDGPTSSSNVFGRSDDPATRSLGAGLEAQLAGGDSGSPLFIEQEGAWRLAAVASFNGSVGRSGPAGASGSLVNFGSIGGATAVYSYAPWISRQMLTAVPEPHAYMLLLAGLGLTWLARRRAG